MQLGGRRFPYRRHVADLEIGTTVGGISDPALHFSLPSQTPDRCLALYGKAGTSDLGWAFLGGARRAHAAFQ